MVKSCSLLNDAKFYLTSSLHIEGLGKKNVSLSL
jgi:hypothetical protein